MRITLITPYYLDSRKERMKELNYCLRKNLNNSLISEVVLVTDTPINIHFHKKLTVINIGRRQMFSDLSNLANSINPNGLNIVCNADIYFKEEDVLKLSKIDYTDTVLALSRWNINKKGGPTLQSNSDSQDSWIWCGVLDVDGNFNMGQRGIDNRIAFELGKNYNVINPGHTIKSYHLHISEMRNYTGKSVAVPPPYLRVPNCHYSGKKIKKVLHIGLNPQGQSELGNMLKSFGKYFFFDWQKILKDTDIVTMRERLIKVNNIFKPDLIFMQIQTPNIITPEVASKFHGFVLNFTGDVREDVNWFKYLSKYIDATTFTNETDTEALREEGINTRFLQIGFESKIFTPEGKRLPKSVYPNPDIVFMANHYGDKFPLSGERYHIANRLQCTYKNRFLLCGQGWEIPSINLMGRMKDEAMVYRTCKIAINANHFLHKRFSSDRIFRIMGSGAFCLTRWYPGIEKDFVDGVHLRTFKTLDEMIFLIDYYLKNEDERISIARTGCGLVHEKFTWMANKNLIKQIASFPQNKIKLKEIIFTKPMSNTEWRTYLSEPE